MKKKDLVFGKEHVLQVDQETPLIELTEKVGIYSNNGDSRWLCEELPRLSVTGSVECTVVPVCLPSEKITPQDLYFRLRDEGIMPASPRQVIVAAGTGRYDNLASLGQFVWSSHINDGKEACLAISTGGNPEGQKFISLLWKDEIIPPGFEFLTIKTKKTKKE